MCYRYTNPLCLADNIDIILLFLKMSRTFFKFYKLFLWEGFSPLPTLFYPIILPLCNGLEHGKALLAQGQLTVIQSYITHGEDHFVLTLQFAALSHQAGVHSCQIATALISK